ncbi:unnamed protein product [Bursaphelenchus xylophilus]|uniref:(pine wood nematode) hypothetical protein n=1 Tax=Bursaphelenchus xylophilus TaxID=6326 RepID=A0A1I7RUF7_BURXY|nr:unnamed protein product [Bursaphelenchus xylophilus]CAG9114094.1 unnamed protein product [Bursaphelenchus xylophilus]
MSKNLTNMAEETKPKTVLPDKPFIRLRGLPYSARDDDIIQFLGPDVHVTYIYFTSNSDGKPSGEAYVQVMGDDDVAKSQEKHQQNLGNRYIEVFVVADADQLIKRIQSTLVDRNTGAVRVRGLPYSCKKEDVYDFFKGMSVVEVIFGKEPGEWGRPTGEAFIRFSTKEEADRAMQLNGQYLGKRYVELFKVDLDAFENFKLKMDPNRIRPLNAVENPWGGYYPPPPPAYGGGYGGPPQEYGKYEGGGGDRAPYYDPYAYRQGPPAPSYGGGRGGGGGGYQPPPASAGYGQDPYYGGGAARGARAGYGPQGGYGGGYDRYNQSEPPTPNKIQMRGLPYRVTQQQIFDFFAPIQPTEIKIGYLDDGRASGDGVVEFANERDAREAFKKDRECIKQRYIELFPGDQMKLPASTTYKSIYKSAVDPYKVVDPYKMDPYKPVDPYSPYGAPATAPAMPAQPYGQPGTWRY